MLKELGQNPTDEMLDQMMVRPQFGAIRRNSSSRRLRSPGHPPAQKQADGGAVGGDNDGRINMREFLRWYARGLKVKRDIAKEDVQDVFQAIAVPGAAAAAHRMGSTPTANWMPTDDLGPHAQEGASSPWSPYGVQGTEYHRKRQATMAVIDPRLSNAQPSHG